jgi:hypothetical protein
MQLKRSDKSLTPMENNNMPFPWRFYIIPLILRRCQEVIAISIMPAVSAKIAGASDETTPEPMGSDHLCDGGSPMSNN